MILLVFEIGILETFFKQFLYVTYDIGLIFLNSSLVETLFRYPLLGTLFFLPIFILIYLLHRWLVLILVKRIADKKILNKRFHLSNIVVLGGLHVIYIIILSFPVEGHKYLIDNLTYLNVTIFIYLLFILSIPIWYRTGSKILELIYFIFCFILLYPYWFVYPYFYIAFIIIRRLWRKCLDEKSIRNKQIFISCLIILSLSGILIYYFFEYFFKSIINF